MNLAILIGCASYDDPKIGNLDYCDEDARAVARTLTQRCGVPDDGNHVRLLLPDSPHGPLHSATRNGILRALSPPARPLHVGTLFFFFSGHGVTSARDGRGYLWPRDTVLEEMEHTAITIEHMLDRLSQWKAATTVLFIDACRNEGIRSKSGISIRSGTIREMERYGRRQMAIFWSCSPGGLSWESPQLKAGVFTHALQQALSDSGRCCTVADLDRYLRQEVPALARKHERPHQEPFLVAQPLEVQSHVIVSERQRAEWESRVGNEVQFEDGEFATPDLSGLRSNVYAIDFGTSHSAIGLAREDGDVELIPHRKNLRLVPSTVTFDENLNYQVGLRPDKAARLGRSYRTISNVKRLIGTDTKIEVYGRSLRPTLVASLIIRSLRDNAQRCMRGPLGQAIVSTPVRYSLRQCNDLLEAFHLAGVDVIRFVPEASAAALVTGMMSGAAFVDECVAVIDLGAGTLDVAIVEQGDGIWEIRASEGDRELGGVDYDTAIARLLAHHLDRSVDWTRPNPSRDILLAEAERAKRRLTVEERVHVVLDEYETEAGLDAQAVTISRADFRQATHALDDRLKDCMARAIRRARIDSTHPVKRVVLAGMGAKIFTVREAIEAAFPDVSIDTAFQEKAVVSGLSRYTGVLNGRVKNSLLLDAMTTSIAMATNAGKILLLERDRTIPTRNVEILTPDASLGYPPYLQLLESDGLRDIPLGWISLVGLDAAHPLEIEADVDANQRILIRGIQPTSIRTEDYHVFSRKVVWRHGPFVVAQRLPTRVAVQEKSSRWYYDQPRLVLNDFWHERRPHATVEVFDPSTREVLSEHIIDIPLHERVTIRVASAETNIDARRVVVTITRDRIAFGVQLSNYFSTPESGFDRLLSDEEVQRAAG